MKKFLIASLIFAVALAAKADVLYWMVSDEYASKADSSSSDVYACLKVSSSNSTTGGTTLQSKTAAQVYDAYDYRDSFAYTVDSTYTGTSPEYYFYIELANGYTTDAMSYTALKNAGYVYTGGTQLPSTLASTGFGQAATYNVPEPTSGLLFLIGGMLLGLKRRRQA